MAEINDLTAQLIYLTYHGYIKWDQSMLSWSVECGGARFTLAYDKPNLMYCTDNMQSPKLLGEGEDVQSLFNLMHSTYPIKTLNQDELIQDALDRLEGEFTKEKLMPDSDRRRIVSLQSLADIHIKALRYGTPSAAKFGNTGDWEDIRVWRDLISIAVRYLYHYCLLTEENIYLIKAHNSRVDRAVHDHPIYTKSINNYATHTYLKTQPIAGTPFHLLPYGTADDSKQVVVNLLRACDIDLSDVYLRFGLCDDSDV